MSCKKLTRTHITGAQACEPTNIFNWMKFNMVSEPIAHLNSLCHIGGSPISAASVEGDVRKSHIVCLSFWGAAYISIGQLHLVPIGFKMKSNKYLIL